MNKEKNHSVASRDKLLHGIVCTGLVFLVIALYSQTLDYTFLNYDDNDYVTENPFVRQGITMQSLEWAFTSTLHDHWHPITWISHMLDVHFFGLNPGIHHFINVAFHALAALMLFMTLLRMTSAYWPSLFVAVLFAVHPMNVQSVAWIAERKNVLSTFFAFYCLYIYAGYAVSRTISRYITCVAVFILGILSKSMLVTIPVLMLLLDWWPLQRLTQAGRVTPKTVIATLVEKIPFFAVALAVGIAMLLIHEGRVEHADFVARSLGDRVMRSLHAYGFYLYKLFWPTNLSIIYPSEAPVHAMAAGGAAAIMIAMTTVAAISWRKYPFVAVGWAWYVITLLPVIGLVQTGPLGLADRFVYIPYVGLFIIIAWGVDAVVGSLRRFAVHAAVVSALGAIILSTMAWRNISIWKDDKTVFSHALSVTQNNYKARVNLGLYYLESGQRQKAFDSFHAALAIKNDDAYALFNLGLLYKKEKNIERACSYFQQASKADESNLKTRINLGACLAEQGYFVAAKEELEHVLSKTQHYPRAFYNLGLVYEMLGDVVRAKEHYARALDLDPSHRLALERMKALP